MPRSQGSDPRQSTHHWRKAPANTESMDQTTHTIKEDFMNTTKVPEPIIREAYRRNSDGSHVSMSVPARGDHFNLSTGEVNVARIIAGVRYDTVRATLVAGKSGIDDVGNYELRRLYRAAHGAYFLLRMDWSDEEGFYGPDFIHPLADADVLMTVRTIIAPTDCLVFLRDWYCAGWIPRNDAEAQLWAEQTLSADDCEEVLRGFGNKAWRA